MEPLAIILLALGVGILAIVAVAAILYTRRKLTYQAKGQFLLLNEQRFMKALEEAMPNDLMITMKVRLLDIVHARNVRTGHNEDFRLADYHVDFVLIDREKTTIRLCIEMDAESQSVQERLARNTACSRALKGAGIPFLRLPLLRYYDVARLRDVIREALEETP